MASSFEMTKSNCNNTEMIRRWNRIAANSVRNNDLYVVERSSGFLVFRQRTTIVERLVEALLPDPDHVLEKGQLLPGRGNSCSIAKVVIDGQTYVLKRYDRRGWVYCLRHVFKRSRALRTWLAAWNFRIRNFSVAEPLVCLEERSWRLLGRSYILSEYLERWQPLTIIWAELEAEEKQLLVTQAANLLGTLHRSGGIHGDTNWDNILVRRAEVGFVFSLVDFDCARIFSRPNLHRARRDIDHFLRDLDRLEPSGGGLCRCFIEHWQAAVSFFGV